MKSVENKPQTRSPKKSAKKIITGLLLFVCILLVLAFFLLPFLISSKQGNSFISGQINNSIDGQLNFAGLSMSWFKGISVAGLSFKDNADKISVEVKQITTKPHYGSLLRGDLSFGKTTIDQPEVNINLKNQVKSGEINTGVSKSNPAKAGYLALVMDVVVNDGNVKLTDSKSKTVELSQINSKVSLRPPGMQTDFDINLAMSDGRTEKSQIRAEGKIKPDKAMKSWSLKGTTGDVIIEVTDLDLESLGSFLELADIDVQARGQVSANLVAVVKDGKFENLAGTVKGQNIDVSGGALKGDNLKTKLLTADVKLKSQEQLINIEKFKFNSDWLEAEIVGMVPTTFSSWSDFLTSESDVNLSGDFELDTAAFLTNMPNTFNIKEGMKITSGKLSGVISSNRGKLNSQVSLSELAGTYEGRKLALSEPIKSNLQISAENKKIRFDKFDVSSSFAKVNASGFIEQLKYDGYINLEKLQSEFGQFVDLGKYEIAGEILEQGTLYVKEDKITGSGASEVKNLRIASKDEITAQEKGTNIKFDFALDRKTNVLTFDSIEAKASLGQINIDKATFPVGEKAKVPLSMDITAMNFDLGKAKPFAVLFASFPKETQIAGIAESKISLSSDKDIYKVITDSTKINNLRFASPDKKPFDANEASLVLDAEINPKEKTINVKKFDLITPQIKIRKGVFNKLNNTGKTKLNGQAELEYDWSAVSAVAASYLPEGLTLRGKRKDSVSFTSEYPVNDANQLLPNLTADAKFGFDQAGYMGLDFGSTDVDMQIRKGLLKIAPFETALNEGRFNFSGQVDFSQKPARLKMAEPVQLMKNIKINDRTTKKLLKYLNPIFADAVNVSGVADFHCERLTIPLSAAAKNKAEISGTVSMNRVSLQASGLLNTIFSLTGGSDRSSDITIRPTKFELKDGFLRYDDMQMEIGDNPVNFKGVIGLDKSLNMTVTLPYTSDFRTVRVGQETKARRIPIPLGGTIDNPILDTGKLIEGQLIQQLPDILERILK